MWVVGAKVRSIKQGESFTFGGEEAGKLPELCPSILTGWNELKYLKPRKSRSLTVATITTIQSKQYTRPYLTRAEYLGLYLPMSHNQIPKNNLSRLY